MPCILWENLLFFPSLGGGTLEGPILVWFYDHVNANILFTFQAINSRSALSTFRAAL